MRYFSSAEFERSAKAESLGIDNAIPSDARRNIEALIDNVLDPLRQAWGKPIRVTSGYRCAALNKAVGGAANSQHLTGEAADLQTGNKVENRKLFQMAIDLKLPFDQLIGEDDFSWLHISYSPRHRRQILKL